VQTAMLWSYSGTMRWHLLSLWHCHDNSHNINVQQK